jgi:hypothetical protein
MIHNLTAPTSKALPSQNPPFLLSQSLPPSSFSSPSPPRLRPPAAASNGVLPPTLLPAPPQALPSAPLPHRWPARVVPREASGTTATPAADYVREPPAGRGGAARRARGVRRRGPQPGQAPRGRPRGRTPEGLPRDAGGARRPPREGHRALRGPRRRGARIELW